LAAQFVGELGGESPYDLGLSGFYLGPEMFDEGHGEQFSGSLVTFCEEALGGSQRAVDEFHVAGALGGDHEAGEVCHEEMEEQLVVVLQMLLVLRAEFRHRAE
jgi:hypothetical protein